MEEDNPVWDQEIILKGYISYFLGHGHSYKDALQDYVKLGGQIPLPPRFAFGVWRLVFPMVRLQPRRQQRHCVGLQRFTVTRFYFVLLGLILRALRCGRMLGLLLWVRGVCVRAMKMRSMS